MIKSRIDALAFDPHETLFESSNGTLAGYTHTSRGLEIGSKLQLIGLSLGKTLALLSGFTASRGRNSVAKVFKNYFDSKGFRERTAFSGIDQLLRRVRGIWFKLYIRTNKHIAPTHLILGHLGWQGLAN